jgi:hypothetical protein
MRKTHPPRNELVKPLFKHFHELLDLYKDFYGTEMISATVQQVSSNLANIQSLLQNGLQKDNPDLPDNVLSALYLNLFSRITGQGSISLLDQLQKILPHPCDHQLEVHFIAELLGSSIHVPISNPEILVAQALEHFEHFEDPDVKCGLLICASYMKTDISVQVNFTSLLGGIIWNMVLPLPWTFSTRPYPWQLHLETQKDIPKH